VQLVSSCSAGSPKEVPSEQVSRDAPPSSVATLQLVPSAAGSELPHAAKRKVRRERESVEGRIIVARTYGSARTKTITARYRVKLRAAAGAELR
jgi:hypothetical protein